MGSDHFRPRQSVSFQKEVSRIYPRAPTNVSAFGGDAVKLPLKNALLVDNLRAGIAEFWLGTSACGRR